MKTPVNVSSDSTNLTEHVYDRLLRLVLSGEIRDGEAVTALGVSKTLGVSRSPAHTAILRLEADGIVSVGTDRQARVVAVTRERVYEIYEMRKLLEGAAVERAAGRMTLADTQPLRKALREFGSADNTEAWSERWARHDEEFHHAVASSCGLAPLERDIGRYRLLHRAMNRALAPPGSLAAAGAEHLAILDAIEARDADGARHAMVTHLEAWERLFIEQLAPDGAETEDSNGS